MKMNYHRLIDHVGVNGVRDPLPVAVKLRPILPKKWLRTLVLLCTAWLGVINGAAYPLDAQTNEREIKIAYYIQESTNARSVAWGDWDNDGDLDLAVGNYDGVNQVFENDDNLLKLSPSQGFGWESTSAVRQTTSVAWGDYDSDGDLDLAVGNLGSPNQVYENVNGQLVCDPGRSYGWESPDSMKTLSVAWGDWDKDGDLDLAVGNGSASSPNMIDTAEGAPNQVFENEGGNLVLDPAAGFGWISDGDQRTTTSVAWGDYDNDADLDLAVGNYEAASQVYENEEGTLRLVWERSAPTPANMSNQALIQRNLSFQTYSVAWGDLNGDGYLELALGDTSGCKLVENGEGRLSNSVTEVNGGYCRNVAWGDWDLDGDLDLVTSIGVFENKKADVLYFALARGSAGGGSVTKKDSLELNTEAGWGWTLEGVNSDRNSKVSSIALGDWDGDGDIDLAMALGDVLNPFNIIYRNDDDGPNLVQTVIFDGMEAFDPSGIDWGDWDKDGDLDLAAGSTTGTIRVYSNDGRALVFRPHEGKGWEYPNSGSTDRISRVVWGDWDRDGDLDLAVGHQTHIRVFDNEGKTDDRRLVLVASLQVEPGSITDIAWGDWDQDADLDLAVSTRGEWSRSDGGYIGSGGRIYETDGKTLRLDPEAGWGWVSKSTVEDRGGTSIAWGDYDEDGDLDLAVGHEQFTEIYRNTGKDPKATTTRRMGLDTRAEPGLRQQSGMG